MEDGGFSGSGSVVSQENHKKKKRRRKSSRKDSKPDKKDDEKEKKKSGCSLAGLKGSMSDKCLWSAFRAIIVGLFLILIGATMATLGFYAKDLSTSQVARGNVSVLSTDESKLKHLDNLTYLGPCIMGIGGVIIVGACVMTFEARDTASKKITPWFKFPSWASSRYSKVDVHPPGQGGGRPVAYCTDVKLMCTQTSELEAAKFKIRTDLLNFNEKLQKITIGKSKSGDGKLQRSSTEPNLAADCKKSSEEQNEYQRDLSLNLPAKTLLENTNMLRVSSHVHGRMLHRQAVSVDYNPEFPPVHRSYSNNSATQSYKRGDSEDSMVMDLYLPQGSVTLKIRDTSKSGGSSCSLQKMMRTPSECSQENRRSLSPSPLSYASALSPKAFSPCFDDGHLGPPAQVLRSRLKLEKSHSSDGGVVGEGGSRINSKSSVPKQRLFVEGRKSQSSDDGYLRVPAKKYIDISSRGSSISSEDSFRTPSPRPFNKQRFAAGSCSISSEDGSLVGPSNRNPNLSAQSGSYSSQDSYTIFESPMENNTATSFENDENVKETDVLLEISTEIRTTHPDTPKRQLTEVQISEEGQKRIGQYRTKTESAKRNPLLRQSAVDS